LRLTTREGSVRCVLSVLTRYIKLVEAHQISCYIRTLAKKNKARNINGSNTTYEGIQVDGQPPSSLLSTITHAITKYAMPAGNTHSRSTATLSHFLFDRRFILASEGAPGGSTMFDVTHICMDRLQHVVVPIAAQHMRGRTSWLRMVRVK
jgi:hypothetical protein